MDFFVGHPLRIIFVVFCFLTAAIYFYLQKQKGNKVRVWPTISTAIIWLLYTLYEWDVSNSGANIRIDLLLIYPFLITISILAMILSFKRR